MSRISLNGLDWWIKGYDGEQWLWQNAHQPGARERRDWFPACVPGSIQTDLWHSGEIADPYFERNSLLIEWVPQRTWLYKRVFNVSEELRGQRVRLVFEGVDYAARFYLNGEYIGIHTGMYTPAVFEVDDRLRYGEENLLVVVIDPAPHEQPQIGYSSLVRTHKSRMTYWWDFCPRMVHLGIWDSVYLEVTGLARLEDVWIRPALSADLRRAEVQVVIELSAGWPAHRPADFPSEAGPGSRQFKAFPVEVEVEIELFYQGEKVAHQATTSDISFSGGRLHARLGLNEPRLWWPNGFGEQALYEAEVRVMSPRLPGMNARSISDRRSVTFGIRRLELVANEGAPSDALPYTFQVNNRRIYAKGWNWVPLDVQYGVERPEKLQRLLDLARRANVNLLRVWGGGLIEKEAFYDLCDRCGILVWQEFIQSSSGIEDRPPEDEGFIDFMVDQARQIIPRRRNHPALALWCGGNELKRAPEIPADNSHPMLAALHDLLRELDPGRAWLPTSSSGPVFGNSLEAIARDPQGLHDVHGPWEHQGLTGQCELYNKGTSLFHSEFGAEGLTNRKALDAVIAREHQGPVSLDNPLWDHLGAWWVKEPCWKELFGPLGNVEDVLRATQFSQASGLGYALEANRRRKYRNSGSIPWQFNEPYPMAACTSAVDYFTQPKPAYYAVARAYKPLHLSACFGTLAWAGRDRFSAGVWISSSFATGLERTTLEAALIGASGRRYQAGTWQMSIPPDASTRLAGIDWPLGIVEEEVFFLDMHLIGLDGALLAANRYPFSRSENLAPLLKVPTTRLQVETSARKAGWELDIANLGDSTAMFIWLEDDRSLGAPGYVYFADNHFCLIPGERRTIQVDWDGVLPAERELVLKAWNTAEVEVRLDEKKTVRR